MHGHFYGNFTGNLAHAQLVCTRPFSRGEGPGDEARWTDEQRFHQFKFHLSQSALHVFHLLPVNERVTYASAVEALKKRFKPIDIEELRSMEFHQRMQD